MTTDSCSDHRLVVEKIFHRQTIEKIFHHPAGAAVEWGRVRSALADLGTVIEDGSGALLLAFGSEAELLQAPRGSDVDEHLKADLQRILFGAGFAPPSGLPISIADTTTAAMSSKAPHRDAVPTRSSSRCSPALQLLL